MHQSTDKREQTPGQVSRRGFLQGTAAAGALVLGLRLDGVVSAGEHAGEGRFSAFLEITEDGAIRITTPTSELGQGIHTNLPRILADELDADWADVEVVMPHADAAFVSPITGRHRTANSESVAIYFEQLRTVGAAAREMLIAAAALQWDVPAEECRTGLSHVRHEPSGREAGYASLAAAASAMPVPEEPRKKRPEEFTLIGKPIQRKDLRDTVSGRTVFGIDVRQPGMLYAALRTPAQAAAGVKRFNADSVMGMPGVVAVTEVDGGVAVIAEGFWQARQAAEALDVEFTQGPAAGLDTESMREVLQQALDDDEAAVPFPDVDTQNPGSPPRPLDRAASEQALAQAQQTLTLDYEVPYLAHLTMEPMVCTAQVTDEACRLWVPSQQPDRGREAAAAITGLPLEAVTLNITHAGGGFGRKWELDFLRQSVQAAAAVKGRPVQLLWTREQDVQHDFYRPGFAVRTRVALSEGRIAGMYSRISGQSIWGFQKHPMLRPGMADPTAAALLIYDIYDFPNKYIDYVEVPWSIPVGLWRSVTLSQNAFFAESAIDEAAAALERDPYELRRDLLAAHPRILKVLDTAAQRAGWGDPRPEGRGLGIAISHGFGSICAQVAEVSIENDRLRVHRLTCAFDCGRQIDPDMIRAQMEGGMIYGLSAALRGDINFRDGAVVESNFHDQPILRIQETPEFVIELIDSDAAPGGAGEASVPAVAPAVANAIYAASGRRLRRLPFSASGLRSA
ncbi:MAG: xanthine dehydrogenase family protein molybdopterin-binding subunit [Gammaproteobacteria bacterium]|nr:xanthine dehydrogenase family protein molybdopterin-binding subunit [Gammaproteobacteria bacterium]